MTYFQTSFPGLSTDFRSTSRNFWSTSYQLHIKFLSTSTQILVNCRLNSCHLWSISRHLLHVKAGWKCLSFENTYNQLCRVIWSTPGQLSGYFRLTFGQLPANFQATSYRLLVNFRPTSAQLSFNFMLSSGQLQVNFRSTYGPLPGTCYMWKLTGSVYLLKTHIMSFRVIM